VSFGRFESSSEEKKTFGARGTKAPCLAEIRTDRRSVETTRHLSTNEASDETSAILAKSTAKTSAQSRSELLKRKFLSLLRRRGKFLLKITENLVLESRLAADEVFDRFGERNLVNTFLQLLGNNDRKDLNSFDRNIFDASDRTARGSNRDG
jgi:hypothetical protein